MPSLLPGNETPSKQLKDWPPPNSIPRPVGGLSGPPGTPDDTWESVARQYNLDVHQLIYFNFNTNNPKEVNWYLHTYIGCNTPSPSGWNWTFKGAKPGIIYIPIQRIDMDAEEMDGSPGVTDFIWNQPEFNFEDPHWFEWFKEIFEKLHIGHLAGEFAGLHMGLLGEIFGWAGAGWLALELAYYTVGQFHEQAVADICKRQYFSGISYGIVLGADRRKVPFILKHGFHRRPVHSAIYPEFEGRFEQAYQMGFVAGLGYGRKMNAAQSSRFRRAVRSHMRIDLNKGSDYPSSFDDTEAWNKWPRAFENYYVEAAASFSNHMLPYLLNGFLQNYLLGK